MSFRDKTKTALKSVIESKGVDGAVAIMKQALESKKMAPEDFSIQELWVACQEAGGQSTDVHEAIVSSAFPKLTGELINSRIISAYDSMQTIGDSLVTTVPSSVENETIAGITATGAPEEVGEAQEYPATTLAEKYVTARNLKYGIRIDITEETIRFDKTGQIMIRARDIGEKCRMWKERIILRAIMDLDTNAYKPAGVATAVYSAGNGNLATGNPFGEEGMQAVRKLSHMMKDDASVQNTADADYIYIDPENLRVLIPQDLEVEAWQLANSMLTPEGVENAQNFFKGRFQPMTSPLITAANATTWFWGNFSRDFWWLEVYPLQVLTQTAAGSDDHFLKDIKARHKARFFGSCACIDFKHVYKSTT